MLGLSEWIALITAALKFPDIVLQFIQLLKKTPLEKHDDLLKRISNESEQFGKDGRPTW